MELDPKRLKETLTSEGYEVLSRRNVWWDCAVLKGDEGWFGSGRTEEKALIRCWQQMCPSELARKLTEKSLAAHGAYPTAEKPKPPRHKGRFISAQQAHRLAEEEAKRAKAEAKRAKLEEAERAKLEEAKRAKLEEAERAKLEEAKRAKLEEAEQAREVNKIARQTKRATSESKEYRMPSAVQAEFFDVSVAPEIKPIIPEGWSVPTGQSRVCGVVHRRRTQDERRAIERVSTSDRLAALRDIESTVRSGLPSLAVMAPKPMQLRMTWWIAGIRRFEAHEPTREITETASEVLHAVGRASKLFWPGSVHALKLSCRPQDIVEVYRLAPVNYTDTTWEAVHELLGKCASIAPFDNGWADGDVLLPHPSDPDGVLERAVGLVERAMASTVTTLPEFRLRKDAKDYPSVELLVKAGSYLRWVRHCSGSPLLWGHAMGAIRWLASLIRDVELNRVADDQYVPPQSWDEMIASGERAQVAVAVKKQSTEERKKEVEDSFPLDGDGSDLMHWLLKALEVLTVPQIVGIVELRPDSILALQVSQLPSDTKRTWRRRFREIQSKVRELVQGEVPKEPEQANVTESKKDLTARARATTRGKKVLLVSNRRNPVLCSKLKALLACDFEWASLGKKPNAMRALPQTLGRYDLVCLVTAFLDSTTRGVLVQAAAKGNTPVVFVGNGSQRQVLEALAQKGQPAGG